MRISGFFFKAGWIAALVVAVLTLRLFVMTRSGPVQDIPGKLDGIYAVVAIACISWAIAAVAKVIEARKAR